MRVETICEKGKIGDEYLNGEEECMAFNQWTKSFTSQNHPTVIKVLLFHFYANSYCLFLIKFL